MDWLKDAVENTPNEDRGRLKMWHPAYTVPHVRDARIPTGSECPCRLGTVEGLRERRLVSNCCGLLSM